MSTLPKPLSDVYQAMGFRSPIDYPNNPVSANGDVALTTKEDLASWIEEAMPQFKPHETDRFEACPKISGLADANGDKPLKWDQKNKCFN